MSKQIGSFSVRALVEKVFAGVAFAATIAMTSVVTFAMCFPGVGIA
jgi:hypothetical protein